MQRRKKWTSILSVAVILVAGAVTAWEIQANRRSTRNLAFFTTDDGKTWFLDDADSIPPFDYGGKEAVRCYVYETAKRTKFAGYLLKFTPKAKAAMLAATPEGRERLRGDASAAMLKRPGQTAWISGQDPDAMDIYRSVAGPGGETDVVPVFP